MFDCARGVGVSVLVPQPQTHEHPRLRTTRVRRESLTGLSHGHVQLVRHHHLQQHRREADDFVHLKKKLRHFSQHKVLGCFTFLAPGPTTEAMFASWVVSPVWSTCVICVEREQCASHETQMRLQEHQTKGVRLIREYEGSQSSTQGILTRCCSSSSKTEQIPLSEQRTTALLLHCLFRRSWSLQKSWQDLNSPRTSLLGSRSWIASEDLTARKHQVFCLFLSARLKT